MPSQHSGSQLLHMSQAISLLTPRSRVLLEQILSSTPFLKHPQPAFLPQCRRPGFTPIQNHNTVVIIAVRFHLRFIIFPQSIQW